MKYKCILKISNFSYIFELNNCSFVYYSNKYLTLTKEYLLTHNYGHKTPLHVLRYIIDDQLLYYYMNVFKIGGGLGREDSGGYTFCKLAIFC